MLPEAERKKYSKLDEEALRKVKIFVEGYFQQQELATNATYQILFRAISDQYDSIPISCWGEKRLLKMSHQFKS